MTSCFICICCFFVPSAIKSFASDPCVAAFKAANPDLFNLLSEDSSETTSGWPSRNGYGDANGLSVSQAVVMTACIIVASFMVSIFSIDVDREDAYNKLIAAAKLQNSTLRKMAQTPTKAFILQAVSHVLSPSKDNVSQSKGNRVVPDGAVLSQDGKADGQEDSPSAKQTAVSMTETASNHDGKEIGAAPLGSTITSL